MKEKTVTLRPYDADVAGDVFSVLFNGIEYETEEKLMELPSASYQLVISALELIRWDVSGLDNQIIKNATVIVRDLRDKQKVREWKRKENDKEVPYLWSR